MGWVFACQIWYSDTCILLYYSCTDYLEITFNSDNYTAVQLWYFAFNAPVSCSPPFTKVALLFRKGSLKTVIETAAELSRKVQDGPFPKNIKQNKNEEQIWQHGLHFSLLFALSACWRWQEKIRLLWNLFPLLLSSLVCLYIQISHYSDRRSYYSHLLALFIHVAWLSTFLPYHASRCYDLCFVFLNNLLRQTPYSKHNHLHRTFIFFTGIRLGTIHIVISLTPEERQLG